MKPLYITIDTEGDSLWGNPDVIRTENSLYIPRFQELCEKYGFIPIWLTDYEMAMDDRYISYIKPKAQRGLCEVGIHVHARNNPPIVKLPNETDGAAYLIEYPVEVMREKFSLQKNLLENRIEMPVRTHRAGRWALNQDYIDILIDEGLSVDCSFTPGIDWSKNPGITPGSAGSDYSRCKTDRHSLTHSSTKAVVHEYPMTIRMCDKLIWPSTIDLHSVLRSGYHFIKKAPMWLRSRRGNLSEMKYILKKVMNEPTSYAEYMIHSSELMPGGSPTFPDKESIEKLYSDLEQLFAYAVSQGFYGATFQQAIVE